MRIFITGGSGFVGRSLVQRLAETEHELVCLARQRSDTSHMELAGATVVRGDVTDPASLAAGMRGCQWVVHLASLFEFWVPDPSRYEEVNVTGTRNVLEAALAAGASKVAHVSTGAVWGDASWPITEASQPGPHCAGAYACSKRAADRVAQDIATTHGLPLVTIYPGAVVGQGDPKAAGRYLQRLVHGRMPAQVLTDHMFSWVDVRDVAEAIVRALEKDDNLGERYLVAAENRSFGDINRMVSEISGTRLPWLTLPDPVTSLGARLLTLVADTFRRPPLLDLAADQVALMRQGFAIDGSKATRELGLEYRPLRESLKEVVGELVGKRG